MKLNEYQRESRKLLAIDIMLCIMTTVFIVGCLVLTLSILCE